MSSTLIDHPDRGLRDITRPQAGRPPAVTSAQSISLVIRLLMAVGMCSAYLPVGSTLAGRALDAHVLEGRWMPLTVAERPALLGTTAEAFGTSLNGPLKIASAASVTTFDY